MKPLATVSRLTVCAFAMLGLFPDEVIAACPGCCSSHGGVSPSCATNGRIYCLDGTISPSCLCSTCGVAPPPPAPAPTPTPSPPACSGGRVLVSSTCVCPGGTIWASVDQVCHTPLAAAACGIERWKVKTGTDASANQIDPTWVPTTVQALRLFPAPPSLPNADRVGVVERTTYVLDGNITNVRMTDDSDYHLVISDPASYTMIVEIPHPDCVGVESPLRSQIVAARQSIDTALKITTSFRSVSVPTRISGVGFWDDLHGQLGVAPNGIELHPVTAFQINPTTSLPPVPSIQVVEFYSVNTDSYFLTGRMNEKNALDGFPALFLRTGMEFTALSGAGSTPGPLAICRFFFKDSGINSTHFYGAGSDCPLLSTTALNNSNFHDEGFDFVVGSVIAKTIIPSICSGSAPFPVYRSFRTGTAAKTSNHRYTVSSTSYSSINSQGYVGEGTQYCTTKAIDHR